MRGFPRPFRRPLRPGGFVAGMLGVALLAACVSRDPETQQRLDAAAEQSDEFASDVLADASPEQTRCIDDRVSSSDLSPVQILADVTTSGEQARIAMLEIIVDCIPDLGSVESYAAFFTKSLESGLPPGVGLDNGEGGCLLQHIIDNAADPAEMVAVGNSPDSEQLFLDGAASCFDAASLATLRREPGTGPQKYGDDPGLDAMYDGCEGGDERLCDLLYDFSNEGSEYYALALDCAGRGLSGDICVPGIDIGPDGLADPGSPGLATLRTECEAGEMISCDMLFSLAAIGSELERVGFTCGGKIAVGALPNCRTRFGS